MMKIGVWGAGHLGNFHIKILNESPLFELVGIHDKDVEALRNRAEMYGIQAFEDGDALMDAVDVVNIVTPTFAHFEIAQKALRKCKHVFIEKPITNTIEEARTLLNLAHEAGVKVQIGHVERFNPAFLAVTGELKDPKFIECHRLSQFNPRGTDVSVVMDLMIHDIDAILSVVNSKVKKLNASGVAVVSEAPDIANARLEFDNGCVANLTASRISLKNMRKSRFFQKDAYITVDFLDKKAEVITMEHLEGEGDDFDITLDLGPGKGKKKINFSAPNVQPNNAIQEELHSFYHAIKNDTRPIVDIEDGVKALELALDIAEKIDNSLDNI